MTSAAAIHAATLTIDTHIDIPWPPGRAPEGGRRADIARLRRGGVKAGCYAAYVPQGPRDAAAEDAAFGRAAAMLGAIAMMAEAAGARVCTTAAAVEDAAAAGITAVIPAVENGYAIGADLGRIQRLRELGACYITLTHNGHNRVSDSAIPRRDLNDAEAEHGGLSAFGRAAVTEMNRVGLLVDVSHVSRAGMLQAAELSRTPIVATHACCRALCDHPRNLDDAQLDVLKATGGLLQVTAVPSFLRPGGKVASVSVADFVDHIDHAVRRMGVAHVGIGSDFDGGGEMQGWHDASESPNVTAELVRRGYDSEAIAALWGGNFLRLMRKAEAASA